MASQADAYAGQGASKAEYDRRKAIYDQIQKNVGGNAGAWIASDVWDSLGLDQVDPRTTYNDPGSAEYGGMGRGVDFWRQQALDRMGSNDGLQQQNLDGLNASYAAMTGNRGPMAVENSDLANRESATRDRQLGALNQQRLAAMGQAPSAAEFQTRGQMNQNMSERASSLGGARGLAGLGGAQLAASSGLANSMGNTSWQGGQARSAEIQDAMSSYGGLSNGVRGQDLGRLKQGNEMSQFNAELNDSWKLGNANLAAQQAGQGLRLSGQDQQWFGQAMAPADKQFQYDQESQAWKAGANADKADTEWATKTENEASKSQLASGIIQGAATAVGTAIGGPVGAAAGSAVGGVVGSKIRR
jgi:hypothetical protein